MNGVMYWGMLLLGGTSTVLLVMGLGLTWEHFMGPRRQRFTERWRAVADDATVIDAGRLIKKRYLSENASLQAWLQQVPAVQVYDRFLQQTGLPITVMQSVVVALASVLACAVVSVLLGWPLVLAWALMLCVLLLELAYLRRQKKQRLVRIDQQLPDALDLMARALQAGHALSGALLIAAKETKQPIASELQTVFDEVNFGISVQVALPHLAERIASDNVRYFVVAALIQSETGGNLADILKSTAFLIRERQKIAGMVRVLSAEGRLSAVILSALPFAIAGLLSWVNPDFMAKLWTDPLGLKLLTGSLVLVGVGIVWMRSLVNVRV
jgi:tight adherence protein B